jgi:hypothetical protein
VHTVSELKKGAIISDVELLTRNMHDMSSDVQNDSYHIDRSVDRESTWVHACSLTFVCVCVRVCVVGGGWSRVAASCIGYSQNL